METGIDTVAKNISRLSETTQKQQHNYMRSASESSIGYMKLAAITVPPLASCAWPVGRIGHQGLLQRHRGGHRICDSAVSCYAKEQWNAQPLLVCSLEGLDVHTHSSFSNATTTEDLK